MLARRIALLFAATSLAGCATTQSIAAPAPTFSIGNVTVPEGGQMGSSAVLTVTKSGPSKSYSDVEVKTSNITATAGTDYTATDVVLHFANNETAKQVSVPILNDTTPEPTETFSVGLIPIRFARVGAAATVTITDDDVAQPPPTPTGVAGETPIADNFDSQAGLEPEQGPATPSVDPVGAFRMFCTAGPIAAIDPMVYPGQLGVSHFHQFVGNSGITENSNYQSLRTSGGSSCGTDQDHPANRSAYWFPAMEDGVGHFVKPRYLNLYYKLNPLTDPACSLANTPHIGQCVDLPNGIRFVFGFNMKTLTNGIGDTNNSEHWAIRYECQASEDGTVSNGTATGRYWTLGDVAAAGCPVGARLMILVDAPNCWDGVNLDSADHRSHMAWATGPYYAGQFFNACPADHPFMIPDMQMQIAYQVDANLKTWCLSSDLMVAGAACGSTFHMDYWEAWSPTIKAAWHDGCLHRKMSCANGGLGNGFEIKGAGVPWNGWPVPPVVPITQ